MQSSYKISEISALYSICNDSLRYYEEKGILSPKRDVNGYRLYGLQDIWKLNVLKDLRELDFSMARIKAYLDDRSVASTLALLAEEETLIEQKMATLAEMKENIVKRRLSIEKTQCQPIGEIAVKYYPPRPCCLIRENVSLDGEIDFLIKKLEKEEEENLYIVGNNHIGAFLSGEHWRQGIYNQYSAVFIVHSGESEVSIPAGDYLTLLYQGGYEQTGKYLPQMLAYMEENGHQLAGEPLEFYRIDIHETSQKNEFLTELQIPICLKQ